MHLGFEFQCLRSFPAVHMLRMAVWYLIWLLCIALGRICVYIVQIGCLVSDLTSAYCTGTNLCVQMFGNVRGAFNEHMGLCCTCPAACMCDIQVTDQRSSLAAGTWGCTFPGNALATQFAVTCTVLCHWFTYHHSATRSPRLQRASVTSNCVNSILYKQNLL